MSESPVSLDDQQLEELGLYVASNKDILLNLFKGQSFQAEHDEKRKGEE